MTDQLVPSWEDVARRYGRKIYNFAYRLTGNPDDAADLVQEVLLRVRKGLPSYTPGSFDGWLWRITRNAFLDGVRTQAAPTDARRFPTTTEPLPVPQPSPDEVLASVRLSEDVQAALLKLPIDFRECVVLCDVVGLTYEEIADSHRSRRLARFAAEFTEGARCSGSC